MEEYKIIKEFPKGGALGKGPRGVVFIKDYWSEGLEKIYVRASDVENGSKGLYVSSWKKQKPIGLNEVLSFKKEESTFMKWNFDGEIPKKETYKTKNFLVPEELKSSIMEHEEALKKELENAFFWGDRISVTTLVSSEELKGSELASYKKALKKAEELHEENSKFHFPLYNAVGRIKDSLIEGSSLDETVEKINKKVVENKQKYNQLLEKFNNSNNFELF